MNGSARHCPPAPESEQIEEMSNSDPPTAPSIFEMPDRSDEFAVRFPEQVRTMLAMLRMSGLGGLAVAECDEPDLREQLFSYFKDRLGDEDIYLYPYEVTPHDVNLARALRDLTQQPRFKNLEFTGKFKSIAVFVYGIEKFDQAHEGHFIHLLNFFRDAFKRIEQPVVIWGTTEFVTKLARSAPDFWSWKEMLFSFPSAATSSPASQPTNTNQQTRRAKAPPLLRYLQAVAEDPDYAVWKDLYLPLKAIRASRALQLAPTHDSLSKTTPDAPKALTPDSQECPSAMDGDPGDLVSSSWHSVQEEYSPTEEPPADACQLISQDQHVIVLGEAGAGKTTVLRRMMHDLASAALEAAAESANQSAIPFFVKLNLLTSERNVEDLILESLLSYGVTEFGTREDLVLLLKGTDEGGIPTRRFVFLMDGLNELSSDHVVWNDLYRFLNEYSQHRFVVSCRAGQQASLAHFHAVVLQRLAGDDIEKCLSKYLGAGRGRRVAHEIYSDPQLEDLAQTPLALYMFAQIAKSSEAVLPKNRGTLFQLFTDNLLERTDTGWWKIFGRSKCQAPLSVRRDALAFLALVMQKHKVVAVPHSHWVTIVTRELQSYWQAATHKASDDTSIVSPQAVIDEIMYSGLLRYSADRERVEFAHHTLQEFFAALALRNQGMAVEPLIQGEENRRHWSGTLVLLYGISPTKTALLFQILGEGNDLGRVWLAADCMANAGGDLAHIADSLEKTMAEGGELDGQRRLGMLFSLGLAYRQLERYAEALTYLRRAAELHPGSPEVQYELGSLYRTLHQYDRAIDHLEEAIRARPDFVDAYNQLGIAYYNQGQYIEALTVFRTTTQLEASNPYHHYNLGTVLKLLHDFASARDAFRTAVGLKADYAEAHTQLEILDRTLTSRAIRLLERIPVLSRLTLEQMALLASRLQMVEYQPEDIVFRMGELGNTFYIIVTGEVEITAPDASDSSVILSRLGPGDFFGEIALLRAVPRTATARVASPARLLVLSREVFDDVLARDPSVAHRLTETSSKRLLSDRQRGRRANLDRYSDPAHITRLAQQKEVTVVMSDIHGSTLLTEAIGPELMVDFLDEYLSRMYAIIAQAGGAIDRSLGDSVMGVFGPFEESSGGRDTTSGARALLAALEMRQAYLDLRSKWRKQSPEFAKAGMGIGLSTGAVAKGTVGAETAVVGSAVNLANKLSKLAIRDRQESEVYVDESTYHMLEDTIIAEFLDPAYTSRKAGGIPLRAYRIIQRTD